MSAMGPGDVGDRKKSSSSDRTCFVTFNYFTTVDLIAQLMVLKFPSFRFPVRDCAKNPGFRFSAHNLVAVWREEWNCISFFRQRVRGFPPPKKNMPE